ncbi:hypothetical protein CKO20_08800 [Rhodocyclus tenuis]|nr:hypothetical protein [Rhodocyclus tenuis]
MVLGSQRIWLIQRYWKIAMMGSNWRRPLCSIQALKLQNILQTLFGIFFGGGRPIPKVICMLLDARSFLVFGSC